MDARFYVLAVCVVCLPALIVWDIFGWVAAAFVFFPSILIVWSVWTALLAHRNRSKIGPNPDRNVFVDNNEI